MRRMFLILAAASAAFLIVTLPPWTTAWSQQPESVIVTNLPDVVPVKGVVQVVEPIRQAILARRVDLVVPPVDRETVSDLVEASDVVTDGYTAVTLSFHGDVRGSLGRAGTVGAILVPDEVSVLEMLRQRSVYHFPLEAKVELTEKSEGDFSVQRQYPLGFPRYKVYLYNSTDRTIDADLYVYLTQ